MNKNQIEVMLFDFDGTLADSLLVAVPIINQVALEMGFNQITVKDLSVLENKSAKEVIKHLKIPAYKLPFVLRRARKLFKDEIQSLYPVPKIPEVLVELNQKKIKLGILTSNTKHTVDHFIAKYDLLFFDRLSTSSGLWSKASRLKKLIKEMGVAIENVVYVGDEMRDIASAKKIGVRAVAVSWGYNSGEALSRENPDFLLDSPDQLLDLVN